MPTYKISVDIKKCMGCGACASVCDNFEMVDLKGEQKSKPKKAAVAEIGCNQDAADSCPVQCIEVKEVK